MTGRVLNHERDNKLNSLGTMLHATSAAQSYVHFAKQVAELKRNERIFRCMMAVMAERGLDGDPATLTLLLHTAIHLRESFSAAARAMGSQAMGSQVMESQATGNAPGGSGLNSRNGLDTGNGVNSRMDARNGSNSRLHAKDPCFQRVTHQCLRLRNREMRRLVRLFLATHCAS